MNFATEHKTLPDGIAAVHVNVPADPAIFGEYGAEPAIELELDSWFYGGWPPSMGGVVMVEMAEMPTVQLRVQVAS